VEKIEIITTIIGDINNTYYVYLSYDDKNKTDLTAEIKASDFWEQSKLLSLSKSGHSFCSKCNATLII